MKRTLITNLLFIFSLLFIQAETVKCLVLQLNDETLVYFPVSEKPTATFADGNIIIDNSSFSISSVGKLYIDNIEDELVNISPLFNEEEITVQSNSIRMRCANADIRLYNSAGQLVKSVVNNSDKMTVIDTSELPKGFYILKAGKTVLKFAKH